MKVLSIFLIAGAVILSFVQTLFSADFDNETQKVKETIAEIELGLKRYKMVNGKYPEDDNRNLVSALCPDYINFQSEDIKEGLLIDPWGYPYVYQRYDPYDYLRWHTYVIYSVGPNGGDENGNGDDIGNW